MSDRLSMLIDMELKLTEYSRMQPWRPGLIDLYVYDILVGMYESDYENGTSMPDYIWRKKPDEVMQHIIDSPRIFDLQYGWEQLDEDIRDYLIQNDFIVDPTDEDAVSDEELQANLEGK